MFDRLAVIESRYEELNRSLMDPQISSDVPRMLEISKEHSDLAPMVEAYRERVTLTKEAEEVEEMLSDPDMKEMAQEEKARIEARIEVLDEQLRIALLPKDPYAGRNLLLEIRAGTGGDEAALFAADLLRMYTKYIEGHGFKTEVLSTNTLTVGGSGGKSAVGMKEVVCLVKGAQAYSRLKFESGVHRVQRVPLTETQGRIHTSAATVAVLPEPDPVEINIKENELRVDVFRASGPGGQSVNTTDSAVRLTHKPSGLVVICQNEKSQHKNKAQALKVLSARLFEMQEGERQQAEAADRRSQVGSGDRSERIRTYNYAQNRVTDHRINLTLYKLDKIMEGDLEDLSTALTADEQARLIEENPT
jgi:peptide chain release factor 1